MENEHHIHFGTNTTPTTTNSTGSLSFTREASNSVSLPVQPSPERERLLNRRQNTSPYSMKIAFLHNQINKAFNQISCSIPVGLHQNKRKTRHQRGDKNVEPGSKRDWFGTVDIAVILLSSGACFACPALFSPFNFIDRERKTLVGGFSQRRLVLCNTKPELHSKPHRMCI